MTDEEKTILRGLLDKEMRAIQADPLLVAAARDRVSKPEGTVPIASVSAVLWEQAELRGGLLNITLQVQFGRPGDDHYRPATAAERIMLSAAIKSASPVLWMTSILPSIGNPETLIDIPATNFPIPKSPEFWTFDVDLRQSSGALLLSTLVLPDRGGVKAYWFAKYTAEGVPVMLVESSQIAGDETLGKAETAVLRELMLMLAFKASPYIPTESRRVPRAEARRVGVKPGHGGDVVFVDLRSVASQEREHADASGEASRDWKHQWIVTGHIRNQWYPSDQTHRAIYVPPYIKGPDGAPLLEKVPRVKR